jgi:hypothetical protein
LNYVKRLPEKFRSLSISDPIWHKCNLDCIFWSPSKRQMYVFDSIPRLSTQYPRYILKKLMENVFIKQAIFLVNQGSMLWSQFSAIFANFRRKNWRFSQKAMLWSIFSKFSFVLSQKRQYFRRFFWRKYFKNHNIGPRSRGVVSISWQTRSFTRIFDTT